ncbi:hypothetical protein H0H81_007682 [Sphagnurus paluster]|uniref:Sm domain-containing protein n=1 Tax=Sphagnurus paluster TaxID=117069 RepID=A0A9P7FXB6_9AGAR|nr:hypothetical protein H0H81_007682 [Sphagnurus paluster]
MLSQSVPQAELSQSAPPETATALARLKALLRRIVRVTITDGRIFIGTFAGTDQPLNILLVNAEEYRLGIEENPEGRYVGQIVIPWNLKAIVSLAILAVLVRAADDLTIYTDNALASGWDNWGWGSTVDFAATDLFTGTSSISVVSGAWAALSMKYQNTFSSYAGLRFDLAGAQPDITITVQSTIDGTQSPSIPLSAFGKGQGNWDRITIQAGGSGATYHLDNIILVSSIVVTPQFLSAEPLINDIIALTTVGAVDFSTVSVTLNKQVVKFTDKTTYNPVDTPSKTITYLKLASPLAPGSLSIKAANTTFVHTLPAVQYGSIVQDVKYPINPHIYGVNFPPSANYIQHLGVPMSRWGGNAVTAYNPFGGFTNAGNDWFFENRASDSADDWIGWVKAAGSATVLTVPALDWVAKDASSYSYPKSLYPDQQKFDPYNVDAGNGLFSNGSSITTDPRLAYMPWNTTAAKQWLRSLKNKPTIVNIDNEIEIAHSTHQDMHPTYIFLSAPDSFSDYDS